MTSWIMRIGYSLIQNNPQADPTEVVANCGCSTQLVTSPMVGSLIYRVFDWFTGSSICVCVCNIYIYIYTIYTLYNMGGLVTQKKRCGRHGTTNHFVGIPGLLGANTPKINFYAENKWEPFPMISMRGRHSCRSLSTEVTFQVFGQGSYTGLSLGY